MFSYKYARIKDVLCTVKLHKHGSLLQTAGHPFPLLLGQPSSALLSTAQAGGPPSVKIGWATKTIIFEDVRGHNMTSFFTCKFFGQFTVQGIVFSTCLFAKIIRNSPRRLDPSQAAVLPPIYKSLINKKLTLVGISTWLSWLA